MSNSFVCMYIGCETQLQPFRHENSSHLVDFCKQMQSQVRVVHEAIFALSLIGAIALWLGLVRPTLRRAARETAQIAEMLSQLPPEMDVEGIIAQVVLGGGAPD